MSSGRYMAYSPSPSTAPHSPHISGMRSATTALVEQEKYLSELFAERQKLGPFMPVLPHSYRLLNQGAIFWPLLRLGGWPGVKMTPDLPLGSLQFGSEHGSHWGPPSGGPSSQLVAAGHRRHYSGGGGFAARDQRRRMKMMVIHMVVWWAAEKARPGELLDKYAVLEILRVTTLLGNASLLDQSGLEHASPLTSGGLYSNGGVADMNGWASAFQSERLGLLQSSSGQSWLGSQGSSSGLIVKKTMRVDIPTDKYPTYNFVGRLLGPRGNSLKRVEATTECRVLIRGHGSIKDPAREEMMRGKPGYEHLNEPLHIVVEAELPVEIIDARMFQAREILEDLVKPVDESHDYVKKQQLRELAMLNGTLRDEASHMTGSVSPFNNSLGMKRAKTRG
ncbi:hypothetical protein Scep_013641 [Stephania cephalantha]|uniref:K Homology domain-containing protein n=1 Tax=Stephania cephalantha TaxID=152367 RepID=A0AAP0JHG2_9MAGN